MVEDEARHVGIAAVLEVLDGRVDVVGGVEGHLFARGDDEDLLGVPLADGGRKAAAHHVAEHVIEDDVGLVDVEEAQVLEEVEGGDDATAGATETGRGAARLDAEHAAKAHARDLVEALGVGVGLAEIVHHGLERLATQQVDGGVGLGIAADLDDAFAQRGKGGGEV